jgi:23S rRNA (guanosine2251-2'-O)-methyltransferase
MAADERIYGVHAVLEALQAGQRRVEKILIGAARRQDARMRRILDLARGRGIPSETVSNAQLHQMLGHAQHQGVVAVVAPLGYHAFAEVIATLARATGPHTLLLLDGVTDVGNFATLIRSAAAFGVEAILLPRHHSVGLTPVVAKRSTGAVERVAIVQVGNVVHTLEELKRVGCWIYGADAGAALTVAEVQWPERVVLVVGAEGRGIRRLVRAHCDTLVRIPMRPGIDSLNTAVAGSIILSSVWAHRAALAKMR